MARVPVDHQARHPGVPVVRNIRRHCMACEVIRVARFEEAHPGYRIFHETQSNARRRLAQHGISI